ncbi:MAG: glycoside hydrolase family 13 protein [Clostridia bacterium]|nr:glycoside hydrolase family 13 protein [Clostridia bacterium]
MPVEPNPGDRVQLLFRAAKGTLRNIYLVISEKGERKNIRMQLHHSDEVFDFFAGDFICGTEMTHYVFQFYHERKKYMYNKLGAIHMGHGCKVESDTSFRFMPGFHVPEWTKGAIQYQIFTDRFRNGCKKNDVNNHEYYYVNGHSWHMTWDSPVVDPDIHNFYGGDLQGVMEKLDYLQSLGVDALYFNPIFVSPSSHKYDTQDYDHIDPHLAIIEEDERHMMQDWEKHNGFATEYIKRTTSLKNLEESDKYFASLCEELHRRGMKIILDGVFNHCGSFHKWMDREGIYVGQDSYDKGAYQSPDSKYREFFNFDKPNKDAPYEGWWSLPTLPKLNYDQSETLKETILSIAEKWARPPYSIDGWRLDVAADLGHTPEVNHAFWQEFRRRVKAVNPNLVIIAEHYGDASPWLQGDQWDTVMNYDAFMDPVSYFLTGMEKHSDYTKDDLYQNGDAFFRSMRANMAKMQEPSLMCSMNQLSNHDHSRFLTRTNRKVGRLVSMGSEAAGEGVNPAVMREAVAIQMTWPGAPTLYYADEAGQVGWTDPDNRRTYPWGHENQEMLQAHHDLIAIRRTYKVLNTGSLTELLSGAGLIAYGRFDHKDMAVVAINNSEAARTEVIPVWNMGARNGDVFDIKFSSDENGHSTLGRGIAVKDGGLTLEMPAHSAFILMKL